MKILYFRLKGYAGIYHGMGLDEIVIPFNSFTSNIILIRGENGCGKSTILNALSLEIDGSDMYRTDMIYDTSGQVNMIDYPAEKEIHLADGSDIYKILIISPIRNNKRTTTRAYISRNGEELNPNGNVSSYKDIRNSILDMDPNYIALSMISSENRGLVDKTPSERKKFMSNVIGSMDFFNNCYKNLSKKSSIYRSNINNIKSKIYNLGDPDNLYATLSAYNQRLSDLDKQKTVLINKIAECKATIKLLDPDNKIQELYQSILDELGSINAEMSKYASQHESLMGRFMKSHQNDIYEEKKNIEENLIKIQDKLYADKASLTFNLSRLDDVQSKINMCLNKINIMKSDNIRDDIETIVSEIKEKLSLYEAVFKGSDMDLSLTKSELLIGKDILDRIKSIIVTVWDNDNQLLDQAIDYAYNGDNVEFILSNIQSNLMRLENLKSDNVKKLDDIKRNLNIASIVDNRPPNCTITDCYFIKEALSFDKKALLSEQSCIQEENEYYDNKIDSVKKDIENLKSIYIIYKDIITIINIIDQYKSILSRLGNVTSYIIDPLKLLKSIKCHHPFNEFSIISDHLNTVDIVEDYNKEKELLVGYEADLKIYKNNQSIIESLTNDLTTYSKEREDINEKINNFNEEIKFNESVLESMRNDLELINSIINISGLLENVKDQKRKLGDKFNKVKEDIKTVKTHVDELNNANSALSALENEYGPLKDNINKLVFSLDKLESYKKDLDTWVDSFDKIEFLKKACSPTTGIQSVFISIYMSQTIKIANELLSYLFGGSLMLLPPEINSDEFRIPFMGSNGGEVRDISLGSTSQKCMIGMTLGFSLMSQGSVKYNILRLDEIDGGLDTSNRLQFVRMLLLLMDIMQVEQCIMCSHNIETETYNANIIYLSKSGIQFLLNDQETV